MGKLNIDALLDKNPQVDREKVKGRQEKVAKVGAAKSKGSHQISPYTGRRVTVVDKMKWTSARKLPSRQVC